MNLNKVFLIGRLTADPETRSTPSGQSVTTIKLATNRTWNSPTGGKQEETEFHTVVAWGKLGEVAQKYLTKGQVAYLEGRIKSRSWQATDGSKRYATDIIAEGLQLGPRAGGASMSGGSSPRPASNYAKPASAPKSSSASQDDEIPVINEDLPIMSNPVVSDDSIQEAEIDLKDIPF
jgi:single-strand DNA-binding protein